MFGYTWEKEITERRFEAIYALFLQQNATYLRPEAEEKDAE